MENQATLKTSIPSTDMEEEVMNYPNAKNTSAKTTASQNTMNMSVMGIIRERG